MKFTPNEGYSNAETIGGAAIEQEGGILAQRTFNFTGKGIKLALEVAVAFIFQSLYSERQI